MVADKLRHLPHRLDNWSRKWFPRIQWKDELCCFMFISALERLPVQRTPDCHKRCPDKPSWCHPGWEQSSDQLIDPWWNFTFGWAHKPKSINFRFSRRSSNRFSYGDRWTTMINVPRPTDHWPASDLGGSSPSCACRQQPKRSDERNAELVLRTIDFDWRYNRIILHCRSTRRIQFSEGKWEKQPMSYFENKKIIFIRFDHLVKLTNVLMT